MRQLMSVIADRLDRASERIGQWLAWLVLLLVALVCYDVMMRYFFRSGSIALQELQWHLFSALFLLGAAATLKRDEHVRVDLIYRSRHVSARGRARINLCGSLLLLAPFCVLIIVTSWPFVYQAWSFAEGSPDPGGLPLRWVAKAMIPLGFFLLLLQGLAECLKNLSFILYGARAGQDAGNEADQRGEQG